MLKQSIFTMSFLLLVGAPIAAQEKPEVDDRRVLVTPEMIEEGKRRYELLRDPYFLVLEIGDKPYSNSTKKVNGKTYKASDRIKFQLIVHNTSNERLQVTITDVYDQIRPQLFRDGQLVPYKQKVAEIVELKDKELQAFREVPVGLEGGKPSAMEVIDLAQWYKQLEPGHYQLSVRRRFIWGGKWMESDSITFEITPSP